MKNKNSSKAGFTLLEILIAVLIIGVLTTIALPMYQGAVDKSKWARLIAPARAVSTAQEAAFMNYGGYTANMDDLDVSLPEGNDMTYTLYTTTNGDDANFIRITSTQLDDVRLAKYYKNNEGFEDQLYCEAKNGNDRANKLCGKLLKGQDLTNTNDGYTMYLIDDAITKPLCDRVSLWWSNNFTHCYKTEEDRCTANNMQYDTFCGWTNTKNKTINEGGVCEGMASGGCNNSIINEGGECISHASGCHGSTINDGGVCRVTSEANYGCDKVTINNGGECIAEGGRIGCDQAKAYDGGKCIGEEGSIYSCRSAKIYDGGVCEGNAGTSACYKPNVYDGGKCIGNSEEACAYGNFYEGSVCEANAVQSCYSTTASGYGHFHTGSVCNGNVGKTCASVFESGSVCNGYAKDACGKGKNSFKAVFQSGSRCVAHVAGACNGTYEEGSCCQGGDNCPASAPRC